MIAEEALVEMGFEKEFRNASRMWALYLETPNTSPTRVRMFWSEVHKRNHVIIEQAEYTGNRVDGLGDSDWDWSLTDGVDLFVNGERELRILVELLETGEVKNNA